MNITTEVKAVTIETKVLHVELTEEEGDLIKNALDRNLSQYQPRRAANDTNRRKLQKILAAFKLALDPQVEDEEEEEDEEDDD